MVDAVPATPRRKGFVLVTTLSMMVVLFMLAVLLTDTAYNALRVSSSFYQSELALQAANAGLVWAQAQMQQDRLWMTSTRGTYATKAVGSVTVSQANQFIVGTIVNSSGWVQKFIINFDVGNASFDPNVEVGGRPGMAYTSCNNLSSAVGGETLREGAHFRNVPPYTVQVVVQGVAVDQTGVVRGLRFVEATFRRDMEGTIDSLAFSGRNMVGEVEAGGMWNVGKSDGVNGEPGIRVMADLLIYSNDAGQFNSRGGRLHLIQDSGHALHLPPTASPSVAPEDLDAPTDFSDAGSAANRFPVVGFKDAYDPTKVDASEKTEIHAGTYVYWDNDKTSPDVRYYPGLDYDPNDPDKQYVFNELNHTIVYTDPEGVKTTCSPKPFLGTDADRFKSRNVTFSQPTEVVTDGSQAANANLAIISAPDVTRSIRFTMEANGAKKPTTTLYSKEGGIVLNGSVAGVGNVVSGGDLTFVGQSVLTPTTGTGLTLYSKGNITMRAANVDSSLASDARSLTVAILEQANLVAPDAAGKKTYTAGASVSLDQDKLNEFIDQILKSSRGDPTTGTRSFSAWLQDEAQTNGNGVKALVQTALANNCQVSKGAVTINLDTDKQVPISPQDQVFFGMVYAWGDFRADVGTTNTVTVQGALVAYGNNPENFDNSNTATYPGHGEGGTVSLKGKNINFIYDPSYLGPLSQMLQTGVTLQKLYWATY